MSDTHADDARHERRRAGWLIVACSALSVLMMSHHPTVSSDGGMGGFVAGVGSVAVVNQIVHGSLIALMLALVPAFLVLTRELGRSLAVRFGFVAHVTGVLWMSGAALIGGFATTALAARYAEANEAELEAARHAFRALSVLQHVLAEAGTFGLVLAVLGWSTAMVRWAGLGRWCGVLGVLVGVAPIAGLATGALRLHVHGMTSVLVALAVWWIGAAAQLIRGR